jgi:hypothetical protein
MCFSAAASFSAGAVLTGVGIVTFQKSKPEQRWFGTIPFLFGTQQIIEGLLWLCLEHHFMSAQWASIWTYAFLFIAQVIWPIWVPFSIIHMQPKLDRSLLQKSLLVLGGILSAYLWISLMVFPVEAKISGHHILYVQDYPPRITQWSGLIYVLVTIIPSFLSPLNKMKWLGVFVLLSYMITAFFYEGYVVSVWCFFASLISVVVLYVIQANRKIIPSLTPSE